MKKIEPKRIIGASNDSLFTIRTYHIEGIQEFLCPDGEDIYHSQEERRRERFREQELAFKNRLAVDSEEQLRYNNLINSIVDYKDYSEYECKTSFKYRVLKFLKLTT
jgi:hypothetical protein